MIRARSPFFWYAYLMGFGLGAGVMMLYSSSVSPAVALESWIKDPSKVGAFRFIAWLFVFVCGLGLSVIGWIEWRLWNGWEPIKLRRDFRGLTVVAIYYDDQDRSNHRRIELSDAKGNRKWFMLDPSETKLCDVGDIVHLSAIGKHVSNIVVTQPFEGPGRPAPATFLISDNRDLTMLSGTRHLWPVLSGAILAKGLEHAIFEETVIHPKSGPAIATGTTAALNGWVLIIFVTIITVYQVRTWFTQTDVDDPLDLPPRRKINWWY